MSVWHELKNRPALLVALVLAVLALAAAIVYTFRNPPYEVLPAQQASTIDTSNWQTYENTRFGFSFRYPSDWKIEDKLQGPEDTDGSAVTQSLNLSDANGSWLTGWIDPAGFGTGLSEKEYRPTVVNGALQLNLPKMNESNDLFEPMIGTYDLVWNYNAHYYFFRVHGLQSVDDEKVFSAIVSTFRFKEPKTSLDTSTWQTYENKELGLSFNFPPDLMLGISSNKPYDDTVRIILKTRKTSEINKEVSEHNEKTGDEKTGVPDDIVFTYFPTFSSYIENGVSIQAKKERDIKSVLTKQAGLGHFSFDGEVALPAGLGYKVSRTQGQDLFNSQSIILSSLNGGVINITYHPDFGGLDRSVFGQILSTFQFTK